MFQLKRRKRNRFSLVLSLVILVVIIVGMVQIVHYGVSNASFLIDDNKKIKESSFLIDETSDIGSKIDRLSFHSDHISLYDRTNDKIIYSYNGDKKSYPASLTKILTTIVAINQIDDFNKLVNIPRPIFHDLFEEGSSMAGFSPNDDLTYTDLLYGTMLASGGEAATGLAHLAADSYDDFIGLMNSTAQNLGMTNSNFTNPTGLHDENQYTTSEDLIKLLDYALDNSKFKKIYSSKEYSVSIDKDFIISSTLFSQTDNDLILGGKTGYTSAAGHCLSTYAEIAGKEYILVTMKANGNSPRENIAIEDHIKIYESIGR